MTLQQEAYEMMNGLSDDNIRFIMEVIRRISPPGARDNDSAENASVTRKMQAFQELEYFRRHSNAGSEIDYEKELFDVIGEKYGSFA